MSRFNATMAVDIFFPSFFFFNDTATTEIYTLSLHDALPIPAFLHPFYGAIFPATVLVIAHVDRKSTRLNSSHVSISYAVFCLKKKKHPTDVSLTLMQMIYINSIDNTITAS